MIKIFFAFLAFIVFLSGNIISQSFTFQRFSPEIVVADTSGFEVVSYATLRPNSGTLSIRIIRTVKVLSPSWDSLGCSICNYQLCYGTSTDTIPPTQYGPGAADDTVSVHFYTRSLYPFPNGTFLDGSGYVKLRAELVSNPLIFVEQEFRACTPNTIGIKQINSIVKDFSLGQNFPNPFNPSTKINFSIPKSDHVSLRVYDLLGREVKVLVNESLTPGEYEVEFEGKGLSSGMYYYSLRAGESVDVKKMVLVK